MTFDLAAPIPILRMFSIDKMREFYVFYLGFSVEWEHRFAPDLPLYVQARRGGAVLHLSEHHGDGTPGTALFLPCTGIDALAEELAARPYGYARPRIERAPWKARTLTVTDPFANRLTFNEYDAA